MKLHKLIFCMVVHVLLLFSIPVHGQHWKMISANYYRYDMTIYAQLEIEKQVVTDFSNYEVAAFADDQCRGYAEVQQKDNHVWLFLRVYSNTISGEKISFKTYKKSTDEEILLNPDIPIVFQSDDRIGYPSAPVTLKTNYIKGDVNDDGEIDEKDVECTIDLIFGSNDSRLNEIAADVNIDKLLNTGDCVGIYNYQLHGEFIPTMSDVPSKIHSAPYSGTEVLPVVVTAENCKTLGLSADYVGYYAIFTAEELYYFVGCPSSNAVLLDDIVINENVLDAEGNLNGTPQYSWTPISSFRGIFDGNGHNISGIYIQSSSSGQIGFVANNYGVIKNLGIKDSYIIGRWHNGAIAGYNNNGGTIENCYSYATVAESANGRTGGIAGYNRGKIYKCYNTGRIIAYTGEAGGVCGSSDTGGDISCCYNLGSVETGTNRANYIGGVTGTNWAKVSYCYNIGTVSSNANTYGSVGGGSHGGFSNCYALTTPLIGSPSNSTGLAFQKTEEEFADGTVCELLNEGLEVPVWKQGTNGYPIFVSDASAEGDDDNGYIKHPDYSTEDNLLYVDDATYSAGKNVILPLRLNSTSEITAYQFDMYLPDGFSLAGDGIKAIQSSHYVRYSNMDGGFIRVVCLSKTNSVLNSDNEIVANITLTASSSLDSICCPVYIRNQYITMKNTQSMTFKEVICNLMPGEYIRGDANGDLKINIGDISCIASLILGTAIEPFNKDAADANLDGKINVGDISSVAGFILNGSFVSVLNAPYAGAYSCPELTMFDMSLTTGREQRGIVYLTNPTEIYSLQFDLHLPYGIRIKQDDDDYCISQIKGSSKGHTLDWALQEDGSLRIINFSATNKCFANNQNGIIDIQFVADQDANECNYEILIKKIVLTGANGTIELGDKVVTVSISPEATGIDEMKSTESQYDVFSVTGIRKSNISRGLNIVNYKKIFVK